MQNSENWVSTPSTVAAKEKTKAEQAIEHKRMIDKCFDVAENPIKEWIALYFMQDIKVLFPDFNDQAKDVLVVHDQGKTYTIGLRPGTIDDPPGFDDELCKIPNVAKALQTIFNAVKVVYGPVVKTIEGEQHRIELENIYPKFDEKKTCFMLCMVNTAQMEYDMLIRDMIKIQSETERIKKKQADNSASEEEVKFLLELGEHHLKVIQKLNNIKKEAIDEMQDICDKFTSMQDSLPVLYIECKEGIKINEDQFVHRLPFISGEQFSNEKIQNHIDRL